MLGLEGYADPTGQVVDRYWLQQCAANFGDLLKEPKEVLALTVTFECPAILLHHSGSLQTTLTELGWQHEITFLAENSPLKVLFPDPPTKGLFSFKATHRGPIHLLFRQIYLLLNCFSPGLHFQPEANQVERLLRLGNGWLKSLPLANHIAGFFLGNDRTLQAIAAKALDTTPNAILKAAEEKPERLDSWQIIQLWKNQEQPDLETLRVLVNTSREAWQTAAHTIKNLRPILQAAAHTTSNPFTAQATMPDWEQAIQGAAAHYHANPNPESWDALAKTILQQDPKLGLHRTRHDWILAQTANDNAILDLGANGGLLSQHLLEQRHNIAELVLVDQNEGALIKAKYRIERLHTQTPVRFLLSNLIYCDPRYQAPAYQAAWDAVVLCEVIEHFEPIELEQTLRNIFRYIRTQKLVLTTPNRLWNSLLGTDGEMANQLRHADHKFDWTLPEAQAWATATAVRFGKQVTLEPVGRVFQTYGSPTIGIVFT